MEKLSMCRVCLVSDIRLCSIASHLQDMFERISSMTFKREDRRPLVACYICIARLQNCYRLRKSCRQSEELLTEMLSSGELKPQDVLITNTFRVVSALHLSLGPALLDSTECHVSEDISDAEFDQLYTEDIVKEAQEEQCTLEGNDESSHLEDPLDIIKEEADDVETDAEYKKFEEGNIDLEEIGWEPDIGQSSQLADNICPKIVKVVLERIDLNNSRVGARVSKKSSIAALKDTEDATTNIRKIQQIKNEQTETIYFKESKIVTKKIEADKPVTTSKTLETSDKVDIYLNKYDNLITSMVNDVCEEKCTNNTSLEQNINSVSSRKNKPFSCSTCNKFFSHKYLLKDHILSHSGDKPFQCNICNKCFKVKQVLKNHILTHSGDKPYKCNICNKCFFQKANLKSHILTHSGEKPYQCNVCNKRFNCKQNLKRHIRTHSGDKPYKCNICNKCFFQKANLKSHILTHSGEKPYQCNVCNKRFNCKQNLKRHIRTHSGDKPYQCNICKRCFTEKYTLHTHILTHSGKKPYQCNICNKGFIRTGHFKTHMLIHTDVKPFQCNVCNNFFISNNHLKNHILTHTGEKPYQCNVCNKRFNCKQILKRHIRTHSGDKPYQCNVCNKRFNCKQILKRHIRTHSGDKPFQCNVCNKCFISNNHLKNHIRTHTGEKPYQCNVCKKCFIESGNYSKHIRTQHKR